MRGDYTELNKLQGWLMLHSESYGWEFERIDKRWDETGRENHQIIVYQKGLEGTRARIWDVICHYGSYGFEQGLLEAMGSIIDEEFWHDTVAGYLTAEKVIELIEITYGKKEG